MVAGTRKQNVLATSRLPLESAGSEMTTKVRASASRLPGVKWAVMERSEAAWLVSGLGMGSGLGPVVSEKGQGQGQGQG